MSNDKTAFTMRRAPHPSEVKRLIELLERLQQGVRSGQLREITACQVNILMMLDRTNARRPSELAAERGVTKSAISQALRRLEAAGLVERRRDPAHKRVVQVRLTEDGERLKRWPASVEDERVLEVGARLGPVRYGVRRWLETLVEAAEGRDFHRERYRGDSG